MCWWSAEACCSSGSHAKPGLIDRVFTCHPFVTTRAYLKEVGPGCLRWGVTVRPTVRMDEHGSRSEQHAQKQRFYSYEMTATDSCF
jgi:hypothetical protein